MRKNLKIDIMMMTEEEVSVEEEIFPEEETVQEEEIVQEEEMEKTFQQLAKIFQETDLLEEEEDQEILHNQVVYILNYLECRKMLN